MEYAAPEANNPARQLSKMDVFSYGVLLLEMACREMPEGPEKRRKLLEELEWTSMAGMVKDYTEKEPESPQHVPANFSVMHHCCYVNKKKQNKKKGMYTEPLESLLQGQCTAEGSSRS